MTRSRRRKLARVQARNTGRIFFRATPVASALLACMPAAYAQERTAENAGLEEIVVTATKRSENLQDVPISIQALGTAKLEQLHVTNFDDYALFLPSVEFQTRPAPAMSTSTCAASRAASVENHSGSLPTVGVYLDEQPVTTIDGLLDIHIYDIARVEALEGPQGHPLRREFGVWHHTHHHEQTRSDRIRSRL
jgi:iron complex outermembrane receptor protein